MNSNDDPTISYDTNPVDQRDALQRFLDAEADAWGYTIAIALIVLAIVMAIMLVNT